MANGTVMWFSTEGYGYIRSDDGEEIHVYTGAIDEEVSAGVLEEGQRVEFEITSGPNGLEAHAVRVYPSQSSRLRIIH